MLVEKENLCLYGFQNETWEVNLPVEEVPPELLEPALVTNHARDGMQKKDWLSLVANTIVKQIFMLEQVIPFRCCFPCNSGIECPIHTENYLYCESKTTCIVRVIITLSFVYLKTNIASYLSLVLLLLSLKFSLGFVPPPLL